MGRTNVVIDRKALQAARKAVGKKTIRELVNDGLWELSKRGRLRNLLALEGKVNWEGDLKAMRKGRFPRLVLVDSGVWIDFFRGTPCAQVDRLRPMLRDGPDPFVCGIVIYEVLRGTRDTAQHRKISREFRRADTLPMPRPVFILAADLYRESRARGITIPSANDFLIAACAIHHDVPLLHRDSDFDKIAGISKLKIA